MSFNPIEWGMWFSIDYVSNNEMREFHTWFQSHRVGNVVFYKRLSKKEGIRFKKVSIPSSGECGFLCGFISQVNETVAQNVSIPSSGECGFL